MTEELPLNKENRIRIARAFKHVPRVDMSIDCVIEGQMGRAIVDNAQNPAAFKLEVGPFIYFAGNVESPGGQELLADIRPYTLIMPSESVWIKSAKNRYRERLIGFERYSYSDENLSWDQLNQLIERSTVIDAIERMDTRFAERIWGQEHFVDLSLYDSPSDFVNRGIGFYMAVNDEITGAAYASLVCSRGIEVSLFILENYRRRGIATALSSCLLRWCLENNAQANWDAANQPSCKLAEKLGYQPGGSYEAYYLTE